ncbi:DMT family transporter [Motiliproteus sp. MSK22-1]|uniref:DMT family transporter n=1 Tax=Motiliproteus sp. MSK22-1 TaxID=1897630 RepID=UPI00097779F2|nr:DMT family transporter [Motiliproteus sp. MSK22-1]OMH39207.1 peptide ABC transporter ATP-binding protein [Motiliproteus sp. MSK22-1]
MVNSASTLTRWVPLIFVVLWSTGFIGAKYALPYVEPFNLLLIRMLITLVVFAALMLFFRSKWPSRQQILHQLVVGSLVHAAYLGGVFAAIKLEMPAGIAALLVGLQPLLTALMAWSTLGERLHPRQWIGLLLGLVGVAMVLLRGQDLGQFDISMGALMAAMLALLGISIGTLYQKRFGAGVDLISASFFQYLATALWMALLSYFFENQQVEWHPQLIWSLAWLVFGLSVTAILLLMYMIREGEASKVASYFYLVPPLTALEAWLLFDEVLSIGAIAGVLVTVVGVFLVLKAPGNPARSVKLNEKRGNL